VIVIPLILILPGLLHNGTAGVFMAEPVSNLIGGGACFITMLATIWPELSEKRQQ
jgi:Na+-driven multidrug efflux pump